MIGQVSENKAFYFSLINDINNSKYYYYCNIRVNGMFLQLHLFNNVLLLHCDYKYYFKYCVN